MEYLAITSNAPGAAALVLIDGPPFTSWLSTKGIVWGDPIWKHEFSGPIGTQGARPSSSEPENRRISIPLLYIGTSPDAASAAVSELAAVLDECRRFGGRITTRQHGAAQRTHVEVLAHDGTRVPGWGERHALHNELEPTIEAVVAPYFLADPMEVDEDFSGGTALSAMTFDALEAEDHEVGVAGLTPAGSLTTERRILHPAAGYLIGDCWVRVDFVTPQDLDGFEIGAVVRRADADNYVRAYLYHHGSGEFRMKAESVVAGVASELSYEFEGAAMSATLGAGEASSAWFSTQGNLLRGAINDGGGRMSLLDAQGADYNGVWRISTTEAARRGLVGVAWTPVDATARIEKLEAHPFAWSADPRGEVLTSDNVIQGDAPALVEAHIEAETQKAAWAMVAWAPKAAAWNRALNGDLERGTTHWDASGSGLFEAALALDYGGTPAGSAGAKGVEITCDAVADSGAFVLCRGPFRGGGRYTASCKVRSGSDTDTVQLAANAGDGVRSTAVALTSSWQAIEFDFNVDYGGADTLEVGVLAVGSGGPTVHVDELSVYEAGDPPALVSQTQGRGAPPPWGLFEFETADSKDSGWSGSAVIDVESGNAPDPFTWAIDPSLVPQDDYTQGELAVEAWLTLDVPSSIIDITATLSARSLEGSAYGGTRYAFPHGSAGRSLGVPDSGTAERTFRLGELLLVSDQDYPQRVLLSLDLGWNGSATGNLRFTNLLLVLSRARAAMTTGRSLTGYRTFMQSTDQVERIIRPDLSGATVRPGEPGRFPDAGLGGALLEFPTGLIETALRLDRRIPDNPDADSDDGYPSTMAAALRCRVTPRWHYMRPS